MTRPVGLGPQPVLRFAPSPNGRLHLGHAFSALLNEAVARRLGGRLLLRIEDIDPQRSRPAFERAIRDDLAWLGLRFEEPVRRQSEHLDAYAGALAGLRERGLVYPCFCSRRGIAAAAAGEGGRDPDGTPLYPGTCRGLDAAEVLRREAAGERPAWRLDLAAALAACPGPFAMRRFSPEGREDRVPVVPQAWGDPVLGRRDVPTSYHLAVVWDDALQGITHVVRGSDLAAATAVHVLLQALLGLDPPLYHHHALLLDEAGFKLAKSAGSEPLSALRERGEAPGEVRRRLGFGAG